MNKFIAFTKKEFIADVRQYRLLIMLAVFIVFGITGPLFAKFMPEIVSSIAPDLQITLNESTAIDSWTQFHKNISQLGFSLTLILFSSCLSSEYVRGTLVIMVTKGLSRPTIILSKFFSAVSIMSVSYWLCFGISYAYTAYLWPDSELVHIVFGAIAIWVFGIMYLSILIFGCVLFRQAFTSIIFLLVVTVSMSLLSMPARIARYSPNFLAAKYLDLLSGTASTSEFIIPMIMTIMITSGFILGAIALFRKKQL